MSQWFLKAGNKGLKDITLQDTKITQTIKTGSVKVLLRCTLSFSHTKAAVCSGAFISALSCGNSVPSKGFSNNQGCCSSTLHLVVQGDALMLFYSWLVKYLEALSKVSNVSINKWCPVKNCNTLIVFIRDFKVQIKVLPYFSFINKSSANLLRVA